MKRTAKAIGSVVPRVATPIALGPTFLIVSKSMCRPLSAISSVTPTMPR